MLKQPRAVFALALTEMLGHSNRGRELESALRFY